MNNFWQFKNVSETEGELMIYGPISDFSWWGDEVTPKQFADDLKALGNITNLTVRLNSGGGDVFAANAIYTQLKGHAADVTIQIDGIAASAATIIMMAGNKIVAPANAMIMVHDPMLMLFGMYNADEMTKMTDTLAKVKDSIIASYVAKTGRSKDELATMMSEETWMTAEEAKAEGFVDEIMFEQNVDASITNDARFMVVNSVLHDMSRFETRPVIGGKNTPKPPEKPPLAVAPASVPKAKEKESEEVEIKNVEDMKKAYPDLCNQLVTSAASDAITAERDRLQAIEEIQDQVAEDLVIKAKFSEPITAAELLHVQAKLNKSQGQKFLNARQEELNKAKEVGAGDSTESEGAAQEAAIVDKIAAGANQKRPESEVKSR